jgi:hypothetical protein
MGVLNVVGGGIWLGWTAHVALDYKAATLPPQKKTFKGFKRIR